MVDTVLSIASRAVVEACEHLGLDGDALMSQAGLRREQVFDPDARLLASQADALWRAAYTRSGDPHLALHAAEALPFGAYKVVDFLAAHSPTVGEAYRRIATYFPIVDARAVLEVMVTGSGFALEMRPRDPGVELPQPAQEYSLAAMVTRARTCAGTEWAPEVVEVTFREPNDSSELRRVFRADIRFNCATPRLLCSRAAWDAPVTGANPALLAVLEDHAARLVGELPPSGDFVSSVRRAISQELNGGEPASARVAKALHLSERTFQRRLSETGHTFAALLDEARTATAKALLKDASMSLADISYLLGFADQSAFTRAFRRWTEATPGEYRRTHALGVSLI